VMLSRTDPCELRPVPVTRTMAALHASASWRRHRHYVTDTVPVDVWREGCWRFVAFSGVLAGRRIEVVFAVYLSGRRPPVRVGVLDVDARFGTGRQSPTGPLQLSNPV
ncbi:MAG TPA: methylamine utilization protein MauD, partial [Streptosporangiaceae bacterium]|nr:methylamine utilization protein MauD [Streptosporangiaceae bacterium]